MASSHCGSITESERKVEREVLGTRVAIHIQSTLLKVKGFVSMSFPDAIRRVTVYSWLGVRSLSSMFLVLILVKVPLTLTISNVLSRVTFVAFVSI